MLFLKLAFITSLFLIGSASAENLIKIENAWSPEAPPVVKVMAGYMTIHNLSNNDVQIKSANSPLFRKVEIHLTQIKNGMVSMVKQENLTIKAKNHIELKSGGLHMMLLGKNKSIVKDSNIPVTLTFNNGEIVKINLKVKDKNSPTMKCGTGKHGSI